MKNIALIGLIAVVIWLVISNGVKDKKILDLQINSEQYQKQQDEFDTLLDSIYSRRARSKKVIDSLQKVLTNIPTDVQIIHNNPIHYVSNADSWGAIIRPIESAIDSSKR